LKNKNPIDRNQSSLCTLVVCVAAAAVQWEGWHKRVQALQLEAQTSVSVL
jgi:hypothetical protein